MPRAAILTAWPNSEAARMSRMVLTGPAGTSRRPWATRGRPGPTSNRAVRLVLSPVRMASSTSGSVLASLSWW